MSMLLWISMYEDRSISNSYQLGTFMYFVSRFSKIFYPPLPVFAFLCNKKSHKIFGYPSPLSIFLLRYLSIPPTREFYQQNQLNPFHHWLHYCGIFMEFLQCTSVRLNLHPDRYKFLFFCSSTNWNIVINF